MPDDDRLVLQRFVDSVFATTHFVSRLDVVLRAEAFDLEPDLIEIIMLLPPGTYHRQALCDQLNSALIGHCWTERFRTVD